MCKEITDNVGLKIVEVKNYDMVLKVISQFNGCFEPSIMEKVFNIEEYAQKLYRNAFTYIMCNQQEVVGFISFYINEDEIYIALIAVDSRYRRQGVGSKLIKFVERVCEDISIRNIRLEVDDSNATAQKAYSRYGFFEYRRATENSIYMIKSHNI